MKALNKAAQEARNARKQKRANLAKTIDGLRVERAQIALESKQAIEQEKRALLSELTILLNRNPNSYRDLQELLTGVSLQSYYDSNNTPRLDTLTREYDILGAELVKVIDNLKSKKVAIIQERYKSNLLSTRCIK